MRKIKYGMLGTATIAERNTIAGMKGSTNSEFYAIAGRNKDKVDRFVKEYGFQKAYYSYDELLDDEEIEVIYIPLPNSMHHEWAIKAMKKGKHVLCEKPIGCTLKEVEEMFKVAEECGVLLMEAFAFLHSPLTDKFKEILDSGQLGKPVMMESSFYTLRHPITNVRMQRGLLGGAFYDLGCYPTSLALTLFDREMPTEINAVAHFTEEHIDDVTLADLTYADGKKVIISVGMCSAYRCCRINIYCEKGNLLYKDIYNSKGEVEYEIQTSEGIETIKMQVPDNYMLEIEKFSNCILNGESMIVDKDFSMKNAEIIDVILEKCGYNNI